MRARVQVSNVVAVLVALWIGATCAGACALPDPGRTTAADTLDLIERDSALLVLNPRQVYPTPLHATVWRMVRECLGYDPGPMNLRWAIADSIVGDPSGQMAYGIIHQPGDGGSPVITVERPFWLNPSVLSHEIIHLHPGAFERSEVMLRCTLYIGLPMPTRRVAPEIMPGLRARAVALRRR